MDRATGLGGMKGLAFVKDPDGYLVEILPQAPRAGGCRHNLECMLL